MLSMTIVQMPDFAKIVKNINFGTAVGLTKTAKEGQAAVKAALHSTFTIRNKWPEIGPFAIKIKPATKTNLQSEIKTAADWLEPHETGKDKTGRGGRIAVPTDQVRRNKRMIIPRGQRPKGLAGKIFEMQTRRGPVLAQRLTRGKRKGLIVLYGLERSVRIKRQSTFYTPIEKVVRQKLKGNVRDGIAHAFATAR